MAGLGLFFKDAWKGIKTTHPLLSLALLTFWRGCFLSGGDSQCWGPAGKDLPVYHMGLHPCPENLTCFTFAGKLIIFNFPLLDLFPGEDVFNWKSTNHPQRPTDRIQEVHGPKCGDGIAFLFILTSN